jgi:hypothetical protein
MLDHSARDGGELKRRIWISVFVATVGTPSV